MKILAIAAGLLLIGAAPAPGQATAASATLLSGGWSTSNSARLTSITGPGILPTRVYRIDATMLHDADVLQFTVVVDGVRIPTEFSEGSSVSVEGKSIAIEQTTPGRLIQGTWKVIQQLDTPAEKIPWSSTPRLNKDLLVASFQTDREFVLSINRTSTDCTGTAMTVSVDGTVLRDIRGAVLSFPEGSSVVARGKSVVLRASGACTGSNTVNGDLRLANDG